MTSPDPLRAIADAVLYEGYILWPYRRSAIKNAQRWTFGGVYPRAWSEAGHPDDRWQMQTEVLVSAGASVDVSIRFLHVVRRQMMDGDRPVDELVVGGEPMSSWEEARERELGPGPFSIEAGAEDEVSVVRSWRQLAGTVDVTRERVAGGLDRLTVRVSNTSSFTPGTREEALAQTLCSCHTTLHTDGAFESATDPPPGAPRLENVGTWPVLVGESPDRSTVLSSPIILEDYPRVAPESPGDLFDGGEVDQLLVLNILALTDEEKAEMRATDPLARDILERTEALTNDQKMALHGQIRELRHVR